MTRQPILWDATGSAWALSGGAACVFTLAVVLSGLAWTVTLVVLAVVVVAWSLRGALVAGTALAIIAWLFLTGFDANAHGELRFTGWADLARLAVLLGAALAGAVAGWLVPPRSYDASRDAESDELVWATPHRLGVPSPRTSTKESSDV
jgi:hypothetical protein